MQINGPERIRRFVPITAMLVLLLAACGGGDDVDTTDSGADADAQTDSGDAGNDSGDDSGVDATADADTSDETDVPDSGDADATPDGGSGLDDDELDPTTGAWSPDFGAAGALGAIGATVYVTAIGPYGDLYVGGQFDQIGGVEAANIARWDGMAWYPVGEGVPILVDAIVFGEPDDATASTIHVGGSAGGGGFIAPPNQLYRWDGSAWTSLGDTIDQFSTIDDLAWVDGVLWVAGDFAMIGELEATGLAIWDGETYSTIAEGSAGVGGSVERIFEYNDLACIAGYFDTVAGESMGPVACLGSEGWVPLGDALNSTVRDVIVRSDGTLVVGGDFSLPGADEGTFVVGLAKLEGEGWVPYAGGVGGGLITKVRDLLETDDGLFVGGQFTGAGPEGAAVAAQNIARYDTEGIWHAVDVGVINRTTISIEPGVFSMIADTSGDIYVGGLFSLAGNLGAMNIARWDGAEWSNVFEAGKNFQGAAGQVFSFATDGEVLYAGGSFVSMGAAPAQNVARWSGTRWEELGGGLPGDVVRALAIDGDGVIAGGAFYEVGITGASFLARWDGATWRAFEPQLNGVVNGIAVCPDGSVVVVGDFTEAGAQTLGGVARWDGETWDALGGGMAAGTEEGDWLVVRAVVCNDDNTIIVGGRFGSAGGNEVINLARFNGTEWEALAEAPDDQVDSLARYDEDLYVGGYFSEIGGVEAARVARYDGTTFHALGDGVTTGLEFSPGTVSSIAAKANGVFVIGFFEQAGGSEARFVAWWDGTAWFPLDSGLNDIGEAAIVYDESVWVGGVFSQAGGLPSLGIGRWIYGAE